MIDPGGGVAPPLAALTAFIAYLVVERALELAVSARHTRRLLARGAREHGRDHYPAIVVMHTLFPLAIIAEVVLLAARPGRFVVAWVALWLGAQLLRWASMRALGERWTTRVIVLPEVPRVRGGPYRWLQHPNYLAVIVEMLAAPLMFGAWRTALVFTAANALLLRVRIRCEERALASTAPASTQHDRV